MLIAVRMRVACLMRFRGEATGRPEGQGQDFRGLGMELGLGPTRGANSLVGDEQTIQHQHLNVGSISMPERNDYIPRLSLS